MGIKRQPLRGNLERLASTVLTGPAIVPAEKRQAAARGDALGEPLDGYLRKVRAHAYRVTDEEVAALRSAGMSDDELFELTVSAAFGAAKQRLDAGSAAIDAVYGMDEEKSQ